MPIFVTLFAPIYPYGQIVLAALGGLIAIFLVIRWFPERRRRRRREDERARQSRLLAKTIDEAEFQAAVGTSKRRYTRRSYLIGGAIGAILFGFLQSPAVGLVAAIITIRVLNGRAKSKLDRYRARVITEEVMPTASSIAGGLASGMSLAQAISDVVRGQGDTAMASSIRRAFTDPRGLEEGLRAEIERAHHDVVREFFEILADGASGARNTAATAATLETFVDLNQRRRSEFQLVQRATAQAKGSRTIIAGIIPFILAGSIAVGGSDTMLHTMGGNAVILAVFGLLGLAIGLTNMIIDRAAR
jgi:hypothetical protein